MYAPTAKYQKCWVVYLSADVTKSTQPWWSANALIPRQLEGCSCLTRYSQHASLTSTICKRFAAGNSIYSDRQFDLRSIIK